MGDSRSRMVEDERDAAHDRYLQRLEHQKACKAALEHLLEHVYGSEEQVRMALEYGGDMMRENEKLRGELVMYRGAIKSLGHAINIANKAHQ